MIYALCAVALLIAAVLWSAMKDCRDSYLLAIALGAVLLSGCQRNGNPTMVKHDEVTHVLAGGTVAWGADYLMRRADWPWYVRWPAAVGAAWALGWGKEKCYDKNSDSTDANMWAIGGAAAMAWRIDL